MRKVFKRCSLGQVTRLNQTHSAATAQIACCELTAAEQRLNSTHVSVTFQSPQKKMGLAVLRGFQTEENSFAADSHLCFLPIYRLCKSREQRLGPEFQYLTTIKGRHGSPVLQRTCCIIWHKTKNNKHKQEQQNWGKQTPDTKLHSVAQCLHKDRKLTFGQIILTKAPKSNQNNVGKRKTNTAH